MAADRRRRRRCAASERSRPAAGDGDVRRHRLHRQSHARTCRHSQGATGACARAPPLRLLSSSSAHATISAYRAAWRPASPIAAACLPTCRRRRRRASPTTASSSFDRHAPVGAPLTAAVCAQYQVTRTQRCPTRRPPPPSTGRRRRAATSSADAPRRRQLHRARRATTRSRVESRAPCKCSHRVDHCRRQPSSRPWRRASATTCSLCPWWLCSASPSAPRSWPASGSCTCASVGVARRLQRQSLCIECADLREASRQRRSAIGDCADACGRGAHAQIVVNAGHLERALSSDQWTAAESALGDAVDDDEPARSVSAH